MRSNAYMEAREERNNTEKFKGCGPQAHVRARNRAAWGQAAANTTRTGEKVWDRVR